MSERHEVQERLAYNEASYRTLNEGIERGHAGDPPDRQVGFRCECARLGCDQVIDVTIAEYEQVRAHPRRFVLAQGHQVPAEDTLVVSGAGWAVLHDAGRKTEATVWVLALAVGHVAVGAATLRGRISREIGSLLIALGMALSAVGFALALMMTRGVFMSGNLPRLCTLRIRRYSGQPVIEPSETVTITTSEKS